MHGDRLILSTVNGPYKRLIDAETLADCVRSANSGAWEVHVATFFVDVRPELIIAFAERHGIEVDALSQSYIKLRDRTGERSPALEAALLITQPPSCP
jgi:hypothetical protein